jgi:hypothetical protein
MNAEISFITKTLQTKDLDSEDICEHPVISPTVAWKEKLFSLRKKETKNRVNLSDTVRHLQIVPLHIGRTGMTEITGMTGRWTTEDDEYSTSSEGRAREESIEYV